MSTKRPTPPEGYELLLGREVPNPVPGGALFKTRDNQWLIHPDIGNPIRESDHPSWVAVPKLPHRDFDIHGRPLADSLDYEPVMTAAPSPHCFWCNGPCKSNTASGCDGAPGPSGPSTGDPKASQAVQKPQLQLIPPALNEETAKAMLRGSVKYGPWNWRTNKVEMMTYLGAMKRHIDKLIGGEDIDPDSGAHHLGCVAASCGIVLDAHQQGTLVDNRPPSAIQP